MEAIVINALGETVAEMAPSLCRRARRERRRLVSATPSRDRVLEGWQVDADAPRCDASKHHIQHDASAAPAAGGCIPDRGGSWAPGVACGEGEIFLLTFVFCSVC